VTVATPVRKEVVEWDEYTGRTEAVESVEVRFKNGQLVKPGDQSNANLQSADAERQLKEANFARAQKAVSTNNPTYTSRTTAAKPGSEMRQALGTAVFTGMLGVAFFGIFLTPVFFSVIMKFFARQPAAKISPQPRPEGPLERIESQSR
jgi:hypothetical protein